MAGASLNRIGDLLNDDAADETPLSLAIVTAAGGLECHVGGRWPSGRRVSPEDRFYGASLAKQLTGVAVAHLVRAGQLDPDAAITAILPDATAWAGEATISQLLHHTAGLVGSGELEAELHDEDWTDLWVMSRLRQAAPKQPPGTTHRYSNASYVVLARIVERVSGMGFADFVGQYLLTPKEAAGMTLSSWPAHPQSDQWSMLGPSLPLSSGDGGLWTTASAFALWLDGQNTNRLSVEHLVSRPGRLHDGTAVNYGWGIGIRGQQQTPVFIHGGSWQGAAAKAMRRPDIGLSVVGLAAGSQADAVFALVDSIFARLGGIP